MIKGSAHVFSEIFLHVNWHCRNDEPQIAPDLEELLHVFIEEYCRKVKGIHFKAVGGTADHVHLVIQMEPFTMPSDFIGKLKGAAAHEMNKRFGTNRLAWQRGYGIVSFSKRILPGVVQYVKNQKEHHRMQTVKSVLEACGDGTEG